MLIKISFSLSRTRLSAKLLKKRFWPSGKSQKVVNKTGFVHPLGNFHLLDRASFA